MFFMTRISHIKSASGNKVATCKCNMTRSATIKFKWFWMFLFSLSSTFTITARSDFLIQIHKIRPIDPKIQKISCFVLTQILFETMWDNKKYSCNTCGKSFDSQKDLYNHEKDHVNECTHPHYKMIRTKCMRCGQKFSVFGEKRFK